MPGTTTVDAYLAALPAERQETARALLPLVEQVIPGAGAVWHGHPVWGLGPTPGKAPVCFLKAYTSYVTFGLWRGQEVEDPSGRLAAGARTMASVRLGSPDEIDAELFADWLRQAVRLTEQAAG
ncbi:DUF1801 domain-containing protein [Kitasatospora sp. NPDC059571]|uniref:DUF1801 domain-containing protein n=1 Tax=Kitasatospora sp. NPDC059571 TaxID=3346871 RepID=UPI0036C67C69